MRSPSGFSVILFSTIACAALLSSFAQEPAAGAKAAAEEKKSADAAEGKEAKADAAAPARDRLEVMKEQLALTPEQIEKIKPIVERDKTRSRQIIADKSLPAADRQKKIGAMLKASLDEISTHLTPEQQAKWKDYKARQRAERQNK
jgi:hypothetical protein